MIFNLYNIIILRSLFNIYIYPAVYGKVLNSVSSDCERCPVSGWAMVWCWLDIRFLADFYYAIKFMLYSNYISWQNCIMFAEKLGWCSTPLTSGSLRGRIFFCNVRRVMERHVIFQKPHILYGLQIRLCKSILKIIRSDYMNKIVKWLVVS